MTDLARFPDLEAAVIELLSGLLEGERVAYSNGFTLGRLFTGHPGTTCDVVTPADLQLHCPFIRVTRSGGTDNQITDSARIALDFFALKRTEASFLARTAHARMISYPHVLSECVIDMVDTTSSPTSVPWSNAFLSLFTATYEVTARRPVRV